MIWEILDTGKASALANMQFDQLKLASYAIFSNQPPLLHLYDWHSPSLTYGYFLKPFDYLCAEELKIANIDMARRPTGGGITMHMTDFAFSIFLPAYHPAYTLNSLENYAFINRMVMKILTRFDIKNSACTLLDETYKFSGNYAQNHCMAQPTKYDILFEGKKIGGAAQRRTKHAFLHQGSIALSLPDSSLLKKITVASSEVIPAILKHTHPLLRISATKEELKQARAQLKSCARAVVLENSASTFEEKN